VFRASDPDRRIRTILGPSDPDQIKFLLNPDSSFFSTTTTINNNNETFFLY
jgi:hypothetical protein